MSDIIRQYPILSVLVGFWAGASAGLLLGWFLHTGKADHAIVGWGDYLERKAWLN
jgi:ABC-type uncharacterized transport system permease subunit